MGGRTPHGVRGLKSAIKAVTIALERRTPHGVRGLKSLRMEDFEEYNQVAPRMGCVD